MAERTCSNCGKRLRRGQHRSRRRCSTCYVYLRRMGRDRPQRLIEQPHLAPLPERLMRRIEKCDDEDGCWVWTGAKSPAGYGVIGLGGKEEGNAQAHRVAYEHFVGPIPDGLHMDHLCRNTSCVNPDHLEPVTQAENNRRSWQARKREAAEA